MKGELTGRETRPQQEISPNAAGSRSTRIFINYRRDDAAGDAGRLYDALSARLGKDSVFMDVDTIQPGSDFAEVISEAVGSCEVLVTVIGKNWLSLADAGGRRRLDDQQDLVRLEIETALERGIRVVPALVQGAQMPQADQLPNSLVKLAGRNAFEISYARWQYDVERLIAALEKSTPQKEASLHNLPRQLTSFVGRRADVTAVTQTLLTSRLLTLTGAGGIGKTRLAIQAASELLGAFRDGVWLVELAPIAAPDLVPEAIAVALGVRNQVGREMTETLTEFLRPRQVLLVLDNCEHVVIAAARMVEALLRACPDLRILATSRESVGIGGEEVLMVGSLSVPDPVGLTAAESVAEYEAVALFRDRATTAVGSFELTHKSAPLVAQVCQRLDGIPLAIELAAARLKVLSLEQIVMRLDDRFRLLTGGSRTALPRQQTLRATIEWSYQLLSESERTLLRRLSVFSGGAGMDAAEATCAGEIIDPGDVLDLLTELISKSMVMVSHNASEARYRLLETIRQFGQEQLFEAGEAGEMRRRHRDWYLSLAGRAESQLQGPDQLSWADLLEVELENLRGAFEWSLQADDAESGLRFATALGRFWYTRGHPSEGLDWLDRALASDGGPTRLRAEALARAAQLTSYLGDDLERAKRLGNESLDLFQGISDQRGVGLALRVLGLVAIAQDDDNQAMALHERSLAALQDVGEKPDIAQSLMCLAQARMFASDYGSATKLAADALTLFRELGDRRFIALSIGLLGRVALFQGWYELAASHLEEGVAVMRELKDQGLAALLLYLGTVERCRGDFERANAVLEESLSWFRRLGQTHPAAWCLYELGIVARQEGNPERAANLLQESLSLGRDMYVLAVTLEAIAGLACRQNQFLRGAKLLGAAQATRERIPAPVEVYDLAEHAVVIALAETALGEAEFRKAWLEGQAMTHDESIIFASDQAVTPIPDGHLRLLHQADEFRVAQ